MSLTVPYVGPVAGRSASIRVEAPQSGNLVAEFGKRLAAAGTQVIKDREDLQIKQSQLAMTRELGQARQEVEQITDPAQIGTAWDAKQQEIRAKYVRADLPQDARDQLDLSFQSLNDQHSLAIGGRAIQLTQSQREANWIEARAQITTEAVNADPTTYGAYLEYANAAIDDRLARGDIDHAQAAKEKEAFRSEVIGARADAAIGADPNAFLAAADQGEYDQLGGVALTNARGMADREIKRRASEAATAAKQAQTAQEKQIGDALTDMTALASAGLKSSDEQFLTRPEVMAHPKYGEAMAAISLRDEMPGIQQMTTAELDAEIAREKAAPKAHKYQADRVALLTKWRNDSATDWAKDGIAAGKAAGMNVPVLPMLDTADPATFAQGLSDRLAYDKFAHDGEYTTTQAVFSPAEAAALKKTLDPKGEVAPKVALAQAILAGGRDQASRVAGYISDDPVFSGALRVMAASKDPTLAAQILSGQQREALGAVTLPPQVQRQLIASEILGADLNLGATRQAEIIAAASALYAEDAAGVNPDGADSILPFKDDTEAQDLFRTAVQRVTGATPDRDGNLTVGGVQTFNDRAVMLPAGVPLQSVETAWNVIDTHLRGGVWSEQYGTVDYSGTVQADPLRALKGASTDGSAPALGANPFRLWADATLSRVGDTDVYELSVQRGGRTFKVARDGDPQGRAWRFKLSDLIAGAKQ